MSRKIHQRSRKIGGALISALFITALAAMLATALAVEQGLLIHETNLITRADQGYLNLQGAQFAAKRIILDYVSQWLVKGDMNNIAPLQTQFPAVKVDKMTITGSIENEQGKFNLNDLQYTQNQPRFVALLRAVDSNISESEANNIAQAITDWITSGSQDPYYLSLNPAYRSSKSQLVNVSELRLINGVTPEIDMALKPYVTALPEATPTTATAAGSPVSQPQSQPQSQSQSQQPPAILGTQIDVNAASIPVFLTLNPAMNSAQAEALIACRRQYRAFASTQAFINDCKMPLSNITVQSTYYLVRISALYDKHVLQLNSLMVTQPQKNNTLKVVTVWQSFE